MRHLLTFVLIAFIGMGVWTSLADNSRCSETESGAIYAENENTSPEFSGDEKSPEIYGDTLYQYDGKTVLMHYAFCNDKDVSSIDCDAILTYKGTTPTDTCLVGNYNDFSVNGKVIKFAVGVDSVAYDLTALPAYANPIEKLILPGFRKHMYTRSFALTDSSWNCDFSFLAYMPEKTPEWLNRFIASIVRENIESIYLGKQGSDGILREYYGLKTSPKKLKAIKARAMSPEQIAKHFALEHERLYRLEFPVAEYDGHGPKYDYMIEIIPVWKSRDGRLITYRFYDFYYTQGIHGIMEEHYMTFDSKSGRLLGYKDIIDQKDVFKVIELLEEQVTARESPLCSSADLGAGYTAPYDCEIFKEVNDSLYYPRPALTDRGLVFTYQPYIKGGFSDGVLHFVIPYSELTAPQK